MSSLIGAFDFPYFFSTKTLNSTTDRSQSSLSRNPSFRLSEYSGLLVKNVRLVKIKGGGGSYFPYILLNEIQTMFSQLAKRSARVLPADLSTDHAHYVKNHRSTVLRRNKNMAVEGGTVSHYYILVIRKFIDFMSLFRHSVWFSFSVKQFPSAEFGICNI